MTMWTPQWWIVWCYAAPCLHLKWSNTKQTHHQSAFSNTCCGRILHMYDRKNMCNGVLMMCCKLFGASQSYTAFHSRYAYTIMLCMCRCTQVDSTPLWTNSDMCNQPINQLSDLLRPLIVRNSDLNNQAIGRKRNPIRQGTLTRALRFCTNWFHASVVKKGWISIR